ncbi:MAG: hypothetical protein CVU05_13250 [Bacteroidetes bacterium HGW-Bacteroidetes-21]|nr:MAG: hypothetical protein CVU05_13250 [Bacteroidetes bacterium HGW-Bacteroidetes-21]
MKAIGLFIIYILGSLTINSLFGQNDSLEQPDIIDGGKAKFKIIEVQWASNVVSYSSEYSPIEKSSKQILGKPNVLPLGGQSSCAWTIKKKSSDGIEFIRVSFSTPSHPKQIAIAESYKPGAIEKITLYGKSRGEEQIVFQGEATLTSDQPRMLNIFFAEIPFEVTEAEIRLNSKKVNDFEIDAIGISTSKDTIKALINLPANVHYQAEKESLGPNINTEYDERAPVISAEGKEIFFVRKFHPINVGGEKDEDDIWYSQYTNKNWSFAINVDEPLNNKFHNFVQSISPDGNTLLLANAYIKDGSTVSVKPGASLSFKTKEGWSFPVEQRIKDFRNNSPYVNYFLSANGKYLLMAIETDEGLGGLDMYVSFRTGENTWSKPINMGPDVNTVANDYSPYLATDGTTLYYSTSGISGFGKEDIFVTRRLDDSWQRWSDPMNMGEPVNSTESDTKFSMPASGSYAYFSSDKGSVGLNDIFRILLPDTVKPQAVALLKGKIQDFESKLPLGGAIIIYKNMPDETIILKETSDTLTGAFNIYLPVGYNYTAIVKADGYVDGKQTLDLTSIYNFSIIEQQPILMVRKKSFKNLKGKLNDKLTDNYLKNAKVSVSTDSLGKNIVAVTYSNENGEFEFTLEDLENDQLFLVVEKENYEQSVFELEETFFETDMAFDFALTPEIKQDQVIEFHNIYFGFGSAEVTDTATIVLDRIVKVMNENATIEIELSGHTDSKSGTAFNQQLSQKRAENAKAYIVSKGIPTERIVAVGYGETRLRNHCADGVDCTDEEHAVNRRIEVKILKM